MKKILKQILAALLIMICILQMSVFSYVNAEESSKDNAETEIELLDKLGFIDDTYGPKLGDEAISRSQFASILAYLRGFDVETENSGRRFIDIPSGYWCAGQIYALYDVGLLNGTSASTFSPDDYVTYPQVIKCLISLLGYDIQAQQLGGYPNGYLAVASQIGLIAKSSAEAVDFATVAKLVVKAMDTELMERKMSSENGITFSKSKYQTPLKEYNNIYYDIGLLTDNGVTTLTGESVVGNGAVVINGTTIERGNCDVSDYLGYNLKYYYKDIDDEKQLLFVIPYKTDVVTLKDEDLDIKNPNFSIKHIYHNAEKGKKYYTIDDYVDVIYNGKAYPEFGVDTLKIEQGNMKLVDNDSDGDYDVIFIDEYYNIYVSGIDTGHEIIYGSYGEVVKYGEFVDFAFYSTDGAKSSETAINPKQIISVFESKDGKSIKLVFSTAGVSGEVESFINQVQKPGTMTADEAEEFKVRAKDMKVIIAGTEYKFSNDYINAVIKGYQGTSIPTLGLTYSFHFDMNGKIAAIESPTGKQYAYLIKMAYINGGSEMSGKTMGRVFLQDGTLMTTVFAKYVKVNGVRYKGQEESDNAVYNCPDLLDEDGKAKKQPVRLSLNNLGEITDVETTNGLTTNDYGYDKSKFTLCLEGSYSYGGHSQRSFNASYTLANDIVIFNVPPLSDFREDELAVIPESQLNEGTQYPISLYDCDGAWSAKFAVIQAGESTDWTQSLFIVESIGEAVLTDGTVGKFVRGNFGNTPNYTFFENKPGVFPTELEPGDICRVVEGVNNKCLNMQILASSRRSNDPFYDSCDGADWNNYWGRLYARSDTAFSLTIDNGMSITAMPFNSTSFMVYDVEANKTRRGSSADMVMNCPIMEDGKIDLSNASDMIFVYRRRGYAKCIVIVKY